MALRPCSVSQVRVASQVRQTIRTLPTGNLCLSGLLDSRAVSQMIKPLRARMSGGRARRAHQRWGVGVSAALHSRFLQGTTPPPPPLSATHGATPDDVEHCVQRGDQQRQTAAQQRHRYSDGQQHAAREQGAGALIGLCHLTSPCCPITCPCVERVGAHMLEAKETFRARCVRRASSSSSCSATYSPLRGGVVTGEGREHLAEGRRRRLAACILHLCSASASSSPSMIDDWRS